MAGKPLGWEVATVTVTFTEPLLGTVPKDPEIWSTYVRDRAIAAVAKQPGSETKIAEIVEEVDTVPEAAPVDEETRGWTSFHSDGDGPFVYNYFIQGHLRDSAATLAKNLGIQALRSKLEKAVLIRPRRLHLAMAGDLTTVERPLRAMTPQGPRVTLVRSDAAPVGTTLTFRVYLLQLRQAELTWDVIWTLFAYGANRGMGQWRNGGWGLYTWTHTEPEPYDLGAARGVLL